MNNHSPSIVTEVLNAKAVRQKVMRMAYQIMEFHYQAETIVMIGIKDNGVKLAEMVQNSIHQVNPSLKCPLYTLALEKLNPLEHPIRLNCHPSALTNLPVVLFDDVANTGKTLAYSLAPILQANPSILQVAVLVDRKHKSYPISPDFIGLSLSTTLQEHIRVQLGDDSMGVELI